MKTDPTRRCWLVLIALVLLPGMFGCVERFGMAPDWGKAKEVEEPPEMEFVAEQEPVSLLELQAAIKDVYFDLDSDRLKSGDRLILRADYHILREVPDVEILVEGHCDRRGTVEYNIDLGLKRAEAVKEYMVHMGMSASRISTVTHGKEMPIDFRDTEEGWRKNRRAHIVVFRRDEPQGNTVSFP